MPRLSNRNPSYRLNKPGGRAVVTLNGEAVYLGPFGSAARPARVNDLGPRDERGIINLLRVIRRGLPAAKHNQ
jgi:hypothetical protein